MVQFERKHAAQISMADMDMQRWPGRTYRYLQVPVLYPFGHGLSYTTFKYSNLVAAFLENSEGALQVDVDIVNTGELSCTYTWRYVQVQRLLSTDLHAPVARCMYACLPHLFLCTVSPIIVVWIG